MPALIRDYRSSSSSERSFNANAEAGNPQVVDDVDYPALSFPGYAEKPLGEQLEPIAVVGMGCRLPGDVSSPAEFWDMMINQRTGQTPKVPASRFNIDAHYHSNNERPGSFNVMGGYFLNSSLQEFDPVLFGISPVEAMWMDPQQRKLLEVVYEAFESAGVTMSEIAGTKTACFVGSFTADFQQMAFKEPWFRHSYAATGVDPGLISNRISHVFNLNGPSIVVNTACSSSVYAVHNACNALRNHECSGAVVGGTNLVLTVDQHMNTAKLGVLSPTSTCHTFDASADGYGRADAVGAVYLKRLSDAVRDGDPIRGVIRSSAVNSNGKVPAVGITHPNLEGQAAVIRHAYVRGGNLDPRLTGYFECHGTGTAVGDPLEVHAVAKAMNENRLPGKEPLLIGAVKTNIGHSEAASGLSALIKAVLMVEKGIIPPTRGVVNPSPAIDWEGWKVQVVTQPVPFPDLPVRRVSVNSFGYGGTNAHMIIEGADSFLPFPSTYSDSQKKRKIPRGTFHLKRPFLLPFSAHDKPTLKRNIAAYGQVAAKYNLLDLSYTLANRRSRLPSKGFVVASHASLDGAFQPNMEAFSFAEKKRPGAVGFAFTGQGAQWVRMGSELMAYYPSFLRTIRQLDLALEDLPDGPDWTLEDVLLEDVKTSRVNEAEFSQPLCTAIQIAIVRLLDAWGIKPVVTVGHSSGEIAAAFAAGLISATEAIVAAYYRGQVVSKVTANGAMMAVGLGAEAAAPFLERLDGKVVIACHNSPSSVTLSGDVDALETVKSKLDAENIFARMVKTGGKAYHSHHMQPVAAAYESLMRNAKAYSNFDLPQPSNAIMVSSVTTAPITGDNVIDSSYWSANLRSPVLFNQAVQRIATDSQFSNVDLLVEIGPHSALSGPIRQICVAHGFNKLGYVPTLLRGEDSASQLLKLAGELFLRDYPLQMERITLIEEPLPSGKIHLVKGSLLVDLPTYQWNYAKDFWAEVRHSREHRAPSHARHDILGGFLPGGSLAEPSWRNKLRIRDIPWLKDHSLGGEAVFPAAAYFSMAMEAITQIHELGPNKTIIEGYVLRDISIKAALVTPDDDDGIEVIYNMRPSVHSEADAQNEWWDFSVSSISDDGYRNDHIAGSISINTRARGQTPKEVPNMLHRATGKSWNQQLREVGFDYGPTFQDMTDIRSDGKTYAAACTTVIKSESGVMEGESRYVLHPGAVDSCLQLLIVAIYAGRLNDMICGAVPIQVDEVAIWTPTADQLKVGSAQAYSWVDQRGIRSFVGGSQLVSSDGELLMEISDMRCTAYEAAVPLKSEEPMKPQPYGEMVWKHDIDSLNSAPIPVNMDITNLIDLAIHKNPALKVIEIDSSYAAAIIPKLGLLDYTVTAKTDEAVEQLNVLTQSYKKVEVLKLDISLEAPGQDKLQSCFDLVVASVGWLGPTTSKNLRDLLVPGGRAILELDAQQSLAPLHEADFSGTHLVLQSQGKSIVVLTAAMDSSLEGNTNGVNNEVVLVYRKSPAAILTPLHKAFEDAGWNATTTSLDACQCKAGGHVIMLADFEGPLLASLEEKELVAIQDLTRTVSSILWVTPGGLLSGKKPEYAMAAGLARSITSEQVALDITTLDFDLDTILEPDVVEIIVKTVERKSRKSGIRESEYYVSEGQIYISRLLPNNQINDAYAYDKEETEAGFLKPDMCLVGRAESGKVVFEADNRVEEPLEADDVEVTVSVCGMNREDILVISGSDYPTTFSHEVGGIVKRVGSHVTGLAVGDEVVGFSFDKFATHQRVHATFLQKLEKGEVLNELVSLPMAYGAALHGLKNLANVQAKETVLILGGTGSPGIAAIAVAKLMNAVPYIAVSNEAEGTRLKSRFGLTESQILLSSEQSIGSQLKAATGRSGADVVFSSGSVQAFIARECWRDIAPFGRFVATGRKNVLKRAVVDTVPLHRGASYLSFDMLDLHAWKPHVLKELLALAISLYRRQAIPALEPISIKNIAEIDDAVASFSDNFHSGKTVLSYEPSETALRILRSRPSFKFRADATYLLVGCLGGLGRSLTSWMMKKGARRFAFLSRSGTDSKQAAILVDDLQAAGVVVDVIRGDVSVEADVKRAVSLIPADHPVRGVVQAAMVLKDGLFQNMPYSNWRTSTFPKVQGTLNLHSALRDTALDFFVTTSSTSGILGTPGQSNYAAGNAFLDSLCRHRRANSQPAASLILPMVLGVGYVAEHPEIEEALKRKGIYGIDEEHLLESFEVAMAIQGSKEPADHVVVGLDPSKLQKSLHEASTTDGFWMDDTRFNAVIHAIKSAGSSDVQGDGRQSILATIRSAKSPAEAMQAASDHFVEKLSRLLLVPLDEFEPDVKAIADYGLDSMIGAELRNWIFKEFALDMPFQQLLGPTLTITKFAAQICTNQGISLE